jgi:hypothetical protein
MNRASRGYCSVQSISEHVIPVHRIKNTGDKTLKKFEYYYGYSKRPTIKMGFVENNPTLNHSNNSLKDVQIQDVSPSH